MMNSNTIKKIEKKQKKDKITSVRLTNKQKEMIEASSRINKVHQSVVLQDALNHYFNLH